MKSLFQKWMAVGVMLLGSLFLLLMGTPVMAADSAGWDRSSVTVSPGDTFSLTFRVTSDQDLGELVGVLEYNSSILTLVSGGTDMGGTGGVGVKSIELTYTFQAIAQGTSTVSARFPEAEGLGITYVTGETLSIPETISATVTVSLSGDNSLTSINPSTGALNESFSSDRTNYTMTVPNSVTSISFSPQPVDSLATVSISGGTSLVVGNNTVTITVTAQNGATRTYTVTVTRQEAATQTETEAPTTAATITGVKAIYTYAGDHTVGETIVPSDILVYPLYSNGTQGSTALNGWSCTNYTTPLVAGDNVFTVTYNGLSTTFTVSVAGVASTTGSTTEASAETTAVEESTGEGSTEEESTVETTEEETTQADITFGVLLDQEINGEQLVAPYTWSASIPEGFNTSTYSYKGENLTTLLNSQGIRLFFLTDTEEGNGTYYVYDEETDSFILFVQGTSEAFTYIFLPLPGDYDLSDYTQVTLEVDGKEVDAWTTDEAQSEGLYLVYVQPSNGEAGLYRYSSETGGLVPFLEDEGITGTQDQTDLEDQLNQTKQEYKKKMNSLSMMLVLAVVIGVAILAALVVVSIKLWRIYKDYEFIEEEEEPENNPEEESALEKDEGESVTEDEHAKGTVPDDDELDLDEISRLLSAYSLDKDVQEASEEEKNAQTAADTKEAPQNNKEEKPKNSGKDDGDDFEFIDL